MKLSILKKRKVKYATAIATFIAIASISLITVNANDSKVSNNSNSVIDKFVNTAANEIGQGRDENNITKYGQWYEDNIDNTDRFAPAPWCAMFISWCANEAGLSEDVIGYYAECSYWKNGFYVQNDLWHDAEGYTPKKGDLLFFDNHYEDGVAVPLDPHSGEIFFIIIILNGCCILSKAFPASIEMIIWFLF